MEVHLFTLTSPRSVRVWDLPPSVASVRREEPTKKEKKKAKTPNEAHIELIAETHTSYLVQNRPKLPTPDGGGSQNGPDLCRRSFKLHNEPFPRGGSLNIRNIR